MELEITQEYTGQQRHLVYLAPMWKQVLDFDLRAEGQSTPVKEILAGKSFHRPLGGMVASPAWAATTGSARRWPWPISTPSAAWPGTPISRPSEIADEWTRQTISTDPAVVRTVDNMLMQSWPAYENYTGPLGMQTLTDITGSHYGPNIESSERNGWGQWHNADHEGVGMDRTVATGTGFAGQYPPEVAKTLRVRRHHARQPAALLPPRALHLQAARRQDGHPVHLRQPLRGRGAGGGACRPSGPR